MKVFKARTNVKKASRLRKAKKLRASARRLNKVRLCVHKTPKHIYAQIISHGASDEVIASASTLSSEIRKGLKSTGNTEAAKAVGQAIAEAALKAGVKEVTFDRSGFPFHGRIQAVADAAREAGLQF